jgi:hypothetical protein
MQPLLPYLPWQCAGARHLTLLPRWPPYKHKILVPNPNSRLISHLLNLFEVFIGQSWKISTQCAVMASLLNPASSASLRTPTSTLSHSATSNRSLRTDMARTRLSMPRPNFRLGPLRSGEFSFSLIVASGSQNDGTPDLICTYCFNPYKNKGDRDRHEREAHTHEKKYLCHIAMCPRGVEWNGFARRSQLVVHLTGSRHKMGYDAARLEAARHNHNHKHTRNVNVNAASNH